MNKQREKKGISPKGGADIPLPGPGRPKGSQNKLTRTAKENIEAVYGALGNVAGHVKFLKGNKRALADFYGHVYPMLIPKDMSVTGANNGPVSIQLISAIHRPDNGDGQNGGEKK